LEYASVCLLKREINEVCKSYGISYIIYRFKHFSQLQQYLIVNSKKINTNGKHRNTGSDR
jgi:hypothetical protein